MYAALTFAAFLGYAHRKRYCQPALSHSSCTLAGCDQPHLRWDLFGSDAGQEKQFCTKGHSIQWLHG